MSREARFNISDSGFALEDGILTPSLIIEGAQNYLRVGKRTGDMAGNLDRLYDHVARIIKQEEEPFCTVENGLHPLEIAFAAKESAERGGFPIALI